MPNPVKVVTPISDKPDDLFICASGVGYLLQGVSYNIAYKNGYKSNLTMIVDYHEPWPEEVRNVRGWTWQEHFNEWNDLNLDRIKCYLEAGTDAIISTPSFSRGDPNSNIHVFQQGYLKQLSLEERVGNVTIDITGFPDEDLFSLLYVLDKPDNRVRLLYSEPPKGTLPRGFGVLETSSVPFFTGEHYRGDTSQDVAVFLVGYDSGRLYSIDDHVRSRDTILIFPKPSFHKNWDCLSKRINANVSRCSINPKDVREITEFNPLAVKDTLQEVYDSYPIKDPDTRKRWYMRVGLAGCTKWPVVGAYLFVRDIMEPHEMVTKEGKKSYDWSPVSIYYSTPVYEAALGMRGSQITEFFIGGKPSLP